MYFLVKVICAPVWLHPELMNNFLLTFGNNALLIFYPEIVFTLNYVRIYSNMYLATKFISPVLRKWLEITIQRLVLIMRRAAARQAYLNIIALGYIK